jgi:hypothetical protein
MLLQHFVVQYLNLKDLFRALCHWPAWMQAWTIRRLCASVPERILEEKVVLDSPRIGFSRDEMRKCYWPVGRGLRGPCSPRRTPFATSKAWGLCQALRKVLVHIHLQPKMISSSENFANYLDGLRNYEMCSLVVKLSKVFRSICR